MTIYCHNANAETSGKGPGKLWAARLYINTKPSYDVDLLTFLDERDNKYLRSYLFSVSISVSGNQKSHPIFALRLNRAGSVNWLLELLDELF